MWPSLMVGYGLGISGFEVAVAVLIVLVSFWWWREMRIDCDEEEILAGIWRLVLFLGAAGFLARKVPGIGMGAGWLVALGFWWWWCRRNKWNMWEWLDVVVPAGLFAGGVANLAWGPSRWMYGAGYLIVFLISRGVSRIYRRFKWYTSGRVGFVGLTGLGLWSIVELVVEIRQGNGIYLVGLTIEQWLAVWFLTASVVAIYLRSGRRITKDLPFLARKTRYEESR